MRHGGGEEERLQRDAQVEELADLVGRHFGDDRAAIALEDDEALGHELPERLPHGDHAHAEIGGDVALPKLRTAPQHAGDDRLAQHVAR